MITPKGIIWDHSRGHTAIIARAQRFHELHPNVEITWEKRSLKESIALENSEVILPQIPGLGIEQDWHFIENCTLEIL
jgi:multiple sugar transport system substrate-binding protein